MEDDSFTYDGARRLADQIRGFWRQRGFPGIRTFVKREDRVPQRFLDPKDRGRPLFVVRSNIGPGGFPPAMASA